MRSAPVDEAASGQEVLERLRSTRYSAVVLDLMMGPGSGFDVLTAIRDEPLREKYIIVVSATSQASIDKLDDESIFAKLRKPFDVDELLGAVRRCVNV